MRTSDIYHEISDAMENRDGQALFNLKNIVHDLLIEREEKEALIRLIDQTESTIDYLVLMEDSV